MIHILKNFLQRARLNQKRKNKPWKRNWNKINSNSDKKRFLLSELKSLNDGTFCDSMDMSIDLIGKLVSKEEVEFYDDEKYEPENAL